MCVSTFGVDIEGESEQPRTLYASAHLLENFQLLFFFLQKDPTYEGLDRVYWLVINGLIS